MDELKVLISSEEIDVSIKKIGEKISKEYEGKEIIFIGVLKGAFIFLADLVRAVTVPSKIDFIEAKSYVGDTSTGIVKITKDLEIDVEGKDVIVVEDILDTGRTLNSICKMLKARKANSVKVCVFLDKPARRVAEVNADYLCYQIPDNFVVGYGLDYDEEFRSIPYVGQVIQNN